MISIIIPVYNTPEIKDCLKSIFKNNFTDFEVIVVDNNSKPEFLKEVKKSFPGVKYLEEKRPSSYISRNTGAREARGDILVFTDADCVVAENWLEQIDRKMNNKQFINGLMGQIEDVNRNKIAEFESRLYKEVNKDKRNRARVDTRNFAIRKEVFKKIGGFEEKLKYGGDMELGARLDDAGYVIEYAKRVIIKHQNETNFKKLLEKRIKQNFDNYNIVKLHDEKFIKKYFPHLVEYSPGLKTKLLRFVLEWIIILNMPFLRFEKNYYCFKKLNIIAIKYGLLTNVVQKTL